MCSIMYSDWSSKVVRKRIGYILIDLSYVVFVTGFLLRNSIGDKTIIFIASFIILFLVGSAMVFSKEKVTATSNNLFDKIIRWISMAPFIVLIAIPLLVFELVSTIKDDYQLKKQFGKLKNLGYKMTKSKENKNKVFYFTYNELVIKFIPNELHDISFDGGKNFIPIVESGIGTYQEKEHLISIQNQYRNSDYRDEDLYDSTEEYIKFITKHISLEKGPKNH